MQMTFVPRITRLSFSRGLALGMFAITTLAGVRSLAQSIPLVPLAARPAQPALAVATPQDNGGTQEKLKVHGQWKIVVKNTDGTIAHTTEFENSLTDTAGLLSRLLAGLSVPGTWEISTFSTTSPCATNYCTIVTSTTAGPSSNNAFCAATCTGGLTYTVVNNAFSLVGSYTATQAGTITGVQTADIYCGQAATAVTTTTPASCNSSTTGGVIEGFTSATSPAFSPVTVSKGQVVQITVAISFS